MNSEIVCPNCKTEIEITEVMSAQLSEKIRADIEAELSPKRQALEKQVEEVKKQQSQLDSDQKSMEDQVLQRVEVMREKVVEQEKKKAADVVAVEIKDRDEQIKEIEEKLAVSQQRDLDLRKKERKLVSQEKELGQKQDALEQENQKTLDAERKKISEKAKEKALADSKREMAERDQEAEELRKKLKEAQDNEATIRKKELELQQKTEELELTVGRTLDEERGKIRSQALKQAGEEHRLHDAEKNKKIDDLVKQLDEAKQLALQGSQQAQGEILELILEDMLRQAFPSDSIEPVPKGVRGGDVIQRVKNTSGHDCGSILWESKRTKNWSGKWLSKLRQDQRDAKAAASILVSTALPDDIDTFSQVEGVWVSHWSCAAGVAMALRSGLLEAASAKQALKGQHGKMERVYDYLASTNFRNRVSGIAEAFITMRNDLEKEKKAILSQWSKREKQIEQALFGTAGMYGDLQGIIGGTLQEIEGMSFSQLEAGD